MDIDFKADRTYDVTYEQTYTVTCKVTISYEADVAAGSTAAAVLTAINNGEPTDWHPIDSVTRVRSFKEVQRD